MSEDDNRITLSKTDVVTRKTNESPMCRRTTRKSGLESSMGIECRGSEVRSTGIGIG